MLYADAVNANGDVFDGEFLGVELGDDRWGEL